MGFLGTRVTLGMNSGPGWIQTLVPRKTHPALQTIGTFRSLRLTVGWPLKSCTHTGIFPSVSGHPAVKRKPAKGANVMNIVTQNPISSIVYLCSSWTRVSFHKNFGMLNPVVFTKLIASRIRIRDPRMSSMFYGVYVSATVNKILLPSASPQII